MPDLDMDEKKLHAHIAAFESALAARHTELDEPSVRRILLALDGSNQDETATRIVARLAQRTGATVLPLCAWETADSERSAYLEGQRGALRREGIEVAAVGDARDVRPPYQQILDGCREGACDLVVVPAPYRDDFDALGRDSVGTNLDILLCRSSTSLLVVREPKSAPERCLSKILLPITPRLAANADAAAWAIRLTEHDGAVRIVAVTDFAPPATSPSAPHAETEIESAMQSPETAGLIAALQHRATEIGLQCRVDLRRGEEVQVIVEEAEKEDLLLILPCCPRDPAGPAFQRVQTVIRLTRNPVLMV